MSIIDSTITNIIPFIKDYNFSIAIIAAAVALVLVLILYLISIAFNRPMDLKLGPFKINLPGRKSKDTRLEKIRNIFDVIGFDDDNCSLVDVIVILTKEKTEEKMIIRLKDTIVRQMTYAEDVMIKIKSLITKHYSELLQTKLKGDESAKMHRDYRYFQVIVTSILDELKRKTIKQSLKDTRILELNDKEWNEFIEQKVELMITIFSEYIDLMYQSNSLVSRDELNRSSKEVEDGIRKELTNLFRELKEIIIEDIKKEEEIEKKLNEEISKKKEDYTCPKTKIKKILSETGENNDNG